MADEAQQDGKSEQSQAPSLLTACGRLLLGRPLANREGKANQIGLLEGIPALGLDGLSSTAYGPEAALSILAAAGAAGLGALDPIMLLILALLGILSVSYWQTIAAYPKSGGAYTVAQANLGVNASLLAVAALMIDYVLTVAVGISAGVAALVSAVPMLHPYTLAFCLGILALLTLANLRGLAEASRLFALPTYLFILCFLIVIGVGGYAALAGGGHPHPVVAPPHPPKAVEALGWWLLLRAFASGCTAMTGVEAVSNGVGAFREPQVTYARVTLGAIVGTLAVLLAGIAYLASAYGVMAMDQTQPGYQSVLSQLVGAVMGRGAFYYVAIASAIVLLCLSSDTSFVGFPRLCRMVAQDKFLPAPFARIGPRLVESVGILYLTVTAGVLLIAFDGITDRLIPLYAIGAFLTFTMSQSGMVAHWRDALAKTGRGRERRRIVVKLCINAVGATATAAALVIIVVAKFTEGGWITVVTIPCVIGLLKSIHRYYDRREEALRDDDQLQACNLKPPLVLVMTREWNKLTDKALCFAMEMSPDVIAVHLAALEGPDVQAEERRLRDRWAKDVDKSAVVEQTGRKPELVFLSAPFRRIHAPLLKLIGELTEKNPDRSVAVLIPEFVKTHWWEYLLSNQRARRLRSAVLEFGGPRVVVIMVPWYLNPPKIADALTAEEAKEPLRLRNVLRRRRKPAKRTA
ncbi:MAG TPA: APC family permease [Xanthobacteraceae bacterium]|nr:APC family permease [Xanthobacteraceae bacterium]